VITQKPACRAVEDYLAPWKRHVHDLAQLLEGIRHLFQVGRGASLAAVGTGALIVKEADHFHGEGMSSAAFRRGPFEMLSDETFVLVFGGANQTCDLNQGLFEDVREQKGRAELVGEGAVSPPFALPNAPRSIHPILEILPVQMITLALAVQAGREPGRFELAAKLTTKEQQKMSLSMPRKRMVQRRVPDVSCSCHCSTAFSVRLCPTSPAASN
jgi:glucosamine--fructose-6-phosphate aminotransferase (isomerizing)